MNLPVMPLPETRIVAGCPEILAQPVLSLAVGIVVFNNSPAEIKELSRTVRRAIARLEESEKLADPPRALVFSIRLKNNGETFLDAEAFGPNTKLSGSRENIGFGKAHNFLMGEAFADGAQLYLALNPGGRLHPDALIEMIAVSRRSGDRALVEASQFPEEIAKPFDPLTLDTPWASGCCLLIPTSVYSSIGGFDDFFFLYCEDVDLSWRALLAGFGVKHAPRALISHTWNKPGTNQATSREQLNAGRYLAVKWGNDVFARKMEADLLAKGWEVRELPANISHISAPSITDFKHGFSFAVDRWKNAWAIPFHSLTQSTDRDNTVDVIVRFHDLAQVWRLSRSLFSLHSQKHQPIQVLLMLQGFNDSAIAAVNDCVNTFDWSAPRRRPIVINVAVPETGDHRSLLWNAGIDASRSRYLGFCDFDDIIYAGGYSYLVHRLQFTGAAAVFASASYVNCSPMHGFDFVFEKRLPPGKSSYDFFVKNFCPPNSILLDRSLVDTGDLYADIALSKTEDRRVFALIVSKYETDWESVGTIVSDYVHRSDGSNAIQAGNLAARRDWKKAHVDEDKFLATLTMTIPVSDIIRMHSAEIRLKKVEDECGRMKKSWSWRLTSPFRSKILKWFHGSIFRRDAQSND